MIYRPYQQDLEDKIYAAWKIHHNVLMTLPTGGGKTVIFAKILAQHDGAAIAIAHRQELVGQISVALATLKVPHHIIAPNSVIRAVVQLQVQVLGYSSYDPNAPKAVAGVDTLIKRGDRLNSWPQQVTLRVQDEDHHTLKRNKWGKAAAMFPNAKGLGVTATPRRTDGAGLGRHADGLADTLIVGPNMRDLIDLGYLTDYRILAPPNNIDLSDVNVTDSGEYSPGKLKTAIRRSRIVGDVVEHYKRHAAGKLGLTFATDVDTAGDIAKQFNEAGVPAEIIHAKTPDSQRVAILNRFKNRKILQLVNVDIFGEGFDLPALEVVSMARPTQSLSLYMQQFGRALRPMKGKEKALILDHAGNVARHGLPDAPRTWSLDRRDKKTTIDPNVIPVSVCPKCTGVYERIHKVCPYCGYVALPAARNLPIFVDGDLLELDETTLAEMRGAVEKVDMTVGEYRATLHPNMPSIGVGAAVKRHALQQEAQRALREEISLWAGLWKSRGKSDSEIYRRFYFKFGTDILTAQTLRAGDAEILTERIHDE